MHFARQSDYRNYFPPQNREQTHSRQIELK
jgi:hypothetical protein